MKLFAVVASLVAGTGKVIALSVGGESVVHKYYHDTTMPSFPDCDLPLCEPRDNSIMVFDSALSREDCAMLIENFEASSSMHYQGAVMVGGKVKIDPALKKNTELHITNEGGLSSTWSGADKLLTATVQKFLPAYQASNRIFSTQQNPLSDEGFRMKKYMANANEHHAYHSDCGHEKAVSPHRLLAVLIYLNTVDVGGETVFLNQGRIIAPMEGSMAIFPTAFSFVHGGRKPVSGSKYVVINFLTT